MHLAPRCSFAPCRYFRSKSRAGVARLDESLALYVMPCGEDWQLEHARTVLELAGQDIQAAEIDLQLGPAHPADGMSYRHAPKGLLTLAMARPHRSGDPSGERPPSPPREAGAAAALVAVSCPLLAQPWSRPWPPLAILCPNAWLNESDHLQVGLSDHLDLARQDYSVCFLPNDHCALPQGRLAAADRALARTNHQDEARGLVGCLSSRGLLWAAHCGGALCLCASPRGVFGPLLGSGERGSAGGGGTRRPTSHEGSSKRILTPGGANGASNPRKASNLDHLEPLFDAF